MPGFTVKSSFHLRNKENSKFLICAPYKCSFNCHGRAATNHAIFKIWNDSSPQMHLIFLSHFFMQLILENSTFILTRRGADAPFLRWYEIERRMLPLVKSSASNQTNPIEWHPKFIRSITHAPRLSVKAPRPRWKASQSRCARALVEKHIFLNRRRRSEQGNYTSIIHLNQSPREPKGHLRGLTEQSLVTLD